MFLLFSMSKADPDFSLFNNSSLQQVIIDEVQFIAESKKLAALLADPEIEVNIQLHVKLMVLDLSKYNLLQLFTVHFERPISGVPHRI